MRMEADRMANLRILEKELTPERQVVLEERRMRVDNVPAELLDEAVREQLFGLHKPYAMPTAGYADDVKKLGVNDLTAFYRRFYAPNNAVLIVAGDTTAEAVRKLAEKYYGPIPSRQVEPRRRPAEGGTDLPQRVDPRRCARRRAALEPRFPRAVLPRAARARHAHALLVLARLFGGSETSRLSRALVADGKIALSASAGYSATSLGLTTFEIARPSGARPQRRRDRDARSATEMKQAARRRRHGGRGRAGAEPAAGERDLFAGFAGRAARASMALRSPPAAASPSSTTGRSASPR